MTASPAVHSRFGPDLGRLLREQADAERQARRIEALVVASMGPLSGYGPVAAALKRQDPAAEARARAAFGWGRMDHRSQQERVGGGSRAPHGATPVDLTSPAPRAAEEAAPTGERLAEEFGVLTCDCGYDWTVNTIEVCPNRKAHAGDRVVEGCTPVLDGHHCRCTYTCTDVTETCHPENIQPNETDFVQKCAHIDDWYTVSEAPARFEVRFEGGECVIYAICDGGARARSTSYNGGATEVARRTETIIHGACNRPLSDAERSAREASGFGLGFTPPAEAADYSGTLAAGCARNRSPLKVPVVACADPEAHRAEQRGEMAPYTGSVCTGDFHNQVDWDYMLVGDQWWKIHTTNPTAGAICVVNADLSVTAHRGECCKAPGPCMPCPH